MIGNYLLFFLFGISTCFLVSTVAHEAIVSGNEVENIELFPYQVSVQHRGHGHVCGGGIIGDRFILTAAHCILDRTRHLRSKHISVLAGTISLNRTEPPAVTTLVEKVFIPKEYNPEIEFNQADIAVLELVDSLQLKHRTNLRRLQLPRDYHIMDRIARVAGFDWQVYNSSDQGSTNGNLEYIWAYIRSDSACKKQYVPEAIQSDRHLCTFTEHMLSDNGLSHPYGICTGDGGSPLVSTRGTVVLGILSRIPPHCRPNPSAVYTRVFHYAGMINNVMKHGHDSEMISLAT